MPAAIAVLLLVAIFLALGPPRLFAASESPEFCGGTCHPMEANYQAWFHAGAHRKVRCVECHLPNDNLARHLIQKGRDGIHDVVVFTMGRVPEPIELSERGQDIVQGNCQECHAQMTHLIDQERTCWSCHRALSHRFGGSVEARTP